MHLRSCKASDTLSSKEKTVQIHSSLKEPALLAMPQHSLLTTNETKIFVCNLCFLQCTPLSANLLPHCTVRGFLSRRICKREENKVILQTNKPTCHASVGRSGRIAPGSLSLHTRECGQLHTPTNLLLLPRTAIRLVRSSVGTPTALSELPGEICGVVPTSSNTHQLSYQRLHSVMCCTNQSAMQCPAESVSVRFQSLQITTVCRRFETACLL